MGTNRYTSHNLLKNEITNHTLNEKLTQCGTENRKGEYPLSLPAITPVAKSLYLCDGHIGFANQKTDLVGIFNSIRAPAYPHMQQHFVIFAQLIGGLGPISFYFDVSFSQTGQLVHTTNTHIVNFSRRDKLIQLAYTMQGCL